MQRQRSDKTKLMTNNWHEEIDDKLERPEGTA